jgi:hypothetical protein
MLADKNKTLLKKKNSNLIINQNKLKILKKII